MPLRAAERAPAQRRVFLRPRSARFQDSARRLPQASACTLHPWPIVFRAAAAAILKLFSGLSEEGGAWAGEPYVTTDGLERWPIRPNPLPEGVGTSELRVLGYLN